VTIRWHSGDRAELRPLFALADDSPAQLDAYIDKGRVLVAVDDGEIVGHAQLIGDELKSLAVAQDRQGEGIGSALVARAIDECRAAGARTLMVATAAADIGNLRFYQRLGFRIRSVERDAFTPATGYDPGLLIGGIELRDRVWLDRSAGD
jgi:predicted N-acetyltransferase YhbS